MIAALLALCCVLVILLGRTRGQVASGMTVGQLRRMVRECDDMGVPDDAPVAVNVSLAYQIRYAPEKDLW